jgi:hypothetical protein
MNEKTKIILEGVFILMVFVVGFFAGLNYSVQETIKKCNEFYNLKVNYSANWQSIPSSLLNTSEVHQMNGIQ